MGDDRDWTWLGEGAAPVVAPVPADVVLWALRKNQRRAELSVRPHPLGQELRCSVDGSLIWSAVFRSGDGRRLGAAAVDHRAAFEGRSWTLAPEGPSRALPA